MSTNPTSVTRASPKFNMRLPEGMRERVAEAALRNGRSMNAELVAYVEAGLQRLDAESLARSIKTIEADIAEIKKRLDER